MPLAYFSQLDLQVYHLMLLQYPLCSYFSRRFFIVLFYSRKGNAKGFLRCSLIICSNVEYFAEIAVCQFFLNGLRPLAVRSGSQAYAYSYGLLGGYTHYSRRDSPDGT